MIKAVKRLVEAGDTKGVTNLLVEIKMAPPIRPTLDLIDKVVLWMMPRTMREEWLANFRRPIATRVFEAAVLCAIASKQLATLKALLAQRTAMGANIYPGLILRAVNVGDAATIEYLATIPSPI